MRATNLVFLLKSPIGLFTFDAVVVVCSLKCNILGASNNATGRNREQTRKRTDGEGG